MDVFMCLRSTLTSGTKAMISCCKLSVVHECYEGTTIEINTKKLTGNIPCEELVWTPRHEV